MRTLLAVTAHPDDESFLFGGTLSLHARAGGRAGLLCLTDGQAGRTGGLCAREDLAAVRREELRRATDLLGIVHIFTPGLLDGALDGVADEEGTRIVKTTVEAFGADVLLTFGPEGASGHADHKACWRWTMAAADGRTVYAATLGPGQEMPAGPGLEPTTVVEVSTLGDLKRRAFLEHRTQIDHLERFDEVMALLAGKEYYHRAQPPWEGGAMERGIA